MRDDQHLSECIDESKTATSHSRLKPLGSTSLTPQAFPHPTAPYPYCQRYLGRIRLSSTLKGIAKQPFHLCELSFSLVHICKEFMVVQSLRRFYTKSFLLSEVTHLRCDSGFSYPLFRNSPLSKMIVVSLSQPARHSRICFCICWPTASVATKISLHHWRCRKPKAIFHAR